MAEIGEDIAIPLARLGEGKCVFCGKQKHSFPKNDKIEPTGWARKTISGVGGRFSEKKFELYPYGISPPDLYKSEGHHCIAFSSFIKGAQSDPPDPKDRFAALNYYLKQKGYDPNNENNTIDLPGRKDKGDDDPLAHYVEFAAAVQHGKPLQLHIGSHSKEFITASNVLLRDIVRSFQQANKCDQPEDNFKSELLKDVQDAEDVAFKMTAGAVEPWICHPAHIRKAEKFAKDMLNIKQDITYPKL